MWSSCIFLMFRFLPRKKGSFYIILLKNKLSSVTALYNGPQIHFIIATFLGFLVNLITTIHTQENKTTFYQLFLRRLINS